MSEPHQFMQCPDCKMSIIILLANKVHRCVNCKHDFRQDQLEPMETRWPYLTKEIEGLYE